MECQFKSLNLDVSCDVIKGLVKLGSLENSVKLRYKWPNVLQCNLIKNRSEFYNFDCTFNEYICENHINFLGLKWKTPKNCLISD